MSRKTLPLTCAAFGTAIVASAITALGAVAATPTGWTPVAHDSFSRTVTGGWAAADLGGSYKLTSASKALGVDGSSAFATLSKGNELSAPVAVRAGDVNASDTITLVAAKGTTYDINHSLAVRVQSDGSSYVGRVRVNSSGKATIGVSRTDKGTSTWLKGAALDHAVKAGQAVHLELQVTGTSTVQVQLRAWVAGTATPAWQVSYSDSDAKRITAAGTAVLSDYAFAASHPVTVHHDDLLVSSHDTAAAPTTPAPPAPTTPAPTASTPTAAPTTPTASTPTTAPSAGTPTSSTGPVAVAVPRDSRGSAMVGTASYPVADGALFVDPSHGSDANPGTEAKPFKTAAYAATKVKSGGSLVLRAGTYHETLAVDANKTVTIQNYPGEAVWFDGSTPVAKWSKTGSSWVTTGWNHKFSSMMGKDAAFKARFVGDNKMAANPDQVFVDGTALKQVASASAVKAGTFYYNESAGTIAIGSDPSGKEVRASDLGRAIVTSAPNSVIEGIGVRRYANGYELGGAVRMGSTGGTIRNVVVEDVATIGVSVSGAKKTIDHVTVERAGLLGLGGHLADGSVVSNSVVSNNNTQVFNDEPVAGGMKFTAARTLRVDNVEANNNHGSGIWIDVSSYNLTVVNNTANNNTKHGIEVEISDTGIVANNQAINDGDDGIILFDSGNFKVYNNDFGGSGLFGIKLAQDDRRQADLTVNAEGRDPRSRTAVDPTVPWITRNVELSNNVFGNGGGFQLYALDGRTKRAVDTWNLTVNGNLFNKRVAKTDPTMVAWGKGDNVTLERFEAPSTLAGAKGSSWKNAQIATSKPVTQMAADKLANASTAVPLPADVAAALSVPTGTQMLGVN